jgi:hypothetical protein
LEVILREKVLIKPQEKASLKRGAALVHGSAGVCYPAFFATVEGVLVELEDEVGLKIRKMGVLS